MWCAVMMVDYVFMYKGVLEELIEILANENVLTLNLDVAGADIKRLVKKLPLQK